MALIKHCSVAGSVAGVGAAELPGAVPGALLLPRPAAVCQPLPHHHRSSEHRTRTSCSQELLLLLPREVGGFKCTRAASEPDLDGCFS